MNSALSVLKNLNGRKAFTKSPRKLSAPALENLEGRELLSGMSCGGFAQAPAPSSHGYGPVCHQAPSPGPAHDSGPVCHEDPGRCPAPAPAPAPGPDCHHNPSPTPAPSTGSGVLAGTVFNDCNHDGVLNGSENYLQGAKVTLYSANSCKPIASVITGANGEYDFTGLAPGNYKIVETPPCDYQAESTYIRSELNPATSGGSNVINATVVDPTSVYANNGGNNTSQYSVVGVLINGAPELTSAGTLSSSLGSSAHATNLNSGFSTFCVDMYTSMSFQGGESYQVKPQLINGINLFNHYAGTNLSSTQGAALQLAIWELLYDKGNVPNFTSGKFAIDPNANSYTDQATLNTVISQATCYFNESAGRSETALFLNAPAYNSGGDGYQSVLATCALDFANVETTKRNDHCPSFDLDSFLFRVGSELTFGAGSGDCGVNFLGSFGQNGKQGGNLFNCFTTLSC